MGDAPPQEEVEDEVDLLCVQILRRLNQLKQRKAADINLKTLCDATIAELELRAKECKARAYNREIAMNTYASTIEETGVAMQKVIATADVVANVLNDDVKQDDVNDVPAVSAAEASYRPGGAMEGAGEPADAGNAVKAKRRKKRAKA